VDFNVGSFSARTEQAFGGEIIARLLGFLRPLESWGNDEMLRVCASNADAVLNMSEDAEYGKLVSIFCSSVFQVGDCSENLRSVMKKNGDPTLYSWRHSKSSSRVRSMYCAWQMWRLC